MSIKVNYLRFELPVGTGQFLCYTVPVMDIHIKQTVGTDNDFLTILKKLDACLDKTIPGRVELGLHSFYNVGVIKDVFVMMDGDKPIGSAAIWYQDDEYCELIRVFMSDDYRGHGLGKLLIEKVEQLAKEKGYKKIYLRTFVQLASAVKLYEKLGFKHIADEEYKYASRRKFTPVSDFWLYMAKNL